MKIASYQGRFVAVVHRLSNNQTRIQDIELRVINTSATDKWDPKGLPFDVDSVEVSSLEYPPSRLIGLVKTQVTQDDLNRLSAARCLNVKAKGGRDMSGRKPSVKAYNLAVHKNQYAGVPIIPVV